MKIKGISFWEQHIERFVVGIALVVCLALVALQFLGEPNAVQVAGRTISPGEVDAQLEEKAQEMDQKLDESRTYEFDASVEPVFARFDQRLNTPVVPAMRLALPSPAIAPTGEAGVDPNRPWVNPPVPVLTSLAVNQHFDTIRPEVAEGLPDLKAIIGANAPYDVTWHTISGKFDLAGFLQQYSTQGPNGEAPYLLSWYNNRIDFIDIKLEREEYVEGEWKNLTLIKPMPGYHSFRVELEGQTIDDTLRTKVLTEAVDPSIRAQVIQPPFYATLTESWTPPSGKKQGPEAIAPDDPAGSLKAERAEIQAKLDAVNNTLKKLGCPDTPPAPIEPPKDPAPTRGGGGGAGAAPGSGISEGSGGQSGGLRPGAGGATDLSQCKSHWNRKKRFETQIARLDEEIQKIEGAAAAAPAPKPVAEAPEEVETIIDIWAHDLDVDPGKTYRYRLSVEVYNPMFGRKLDLIPEQQPLAEKFTKISEPSEWTQAVTAQPPLRMFVTQARTSNPASLGMALGQATAEVYRFHNGRWWLESFPVAPGDRVGDVKSSRGGASVDYGTDWFVLDIVPILGVDQNEEKNGYGAMVMLQSLSDPSKIEWRAPRADASDAERRSLNGRVKLADLEGDAVAAAAGGGTTATN